MIVTNMNSPDVRRYESISPYFKQAFEKIKVFLDGDVSVGRHELDGNILYANVIEYETKKRSECLFEKHKRYIDIQVVLEGSETIGFESEDKLELLEDKLDESDYALYSLNDEYDTVTLCRGELAIIFEDEPHAPGIAVNDEVSKVRKAVFKVLAK